MFRNIPPKCEVWRCIKHSGMLFPVFSKNQCPTRCIFQHLRRDRESLQCIEFRVSRLEQELPSFSLVLWNENEKFPIQSRALSRDREIQSFHLEIRGEIEKLFLWFSVLISIFVGIDTDTLLHEFMMLLDVVFSGGTLCRDNRRLIGTPLIIIALQSQKNRD